MPITKERKKLYPKNWIDISQQVKTRAGLKCEICDVENGLLHPKSGSKVILTVHHLDFNPQNNEDYNLIAICQRCHNRLDKRFRARNRKNNEKA